eukprot:474927-Pyramimonas_sp.AAC.1
MRSRNAGALTSETNGEWPAPSVLVIHRRRPGLASLAPIVSLGQGSGGHAPAGPSACLSLARGRA